jgi:hypothetical protein
MRITANINIALKLNTDDTWTGPQTSASSAPGASAVSINWKLALSAKIVKIDISTQYKYF